MSKINKFNDWLAEKITNGVATMWCAYFFALLSCVSLPASIASHSLVTMVSWIAQTFLQLVLLSIILVGQKLSADKHDDAIDHLQDIKDHLGIDK